MADAEFAAGNQEFVKENWKGALDHFSRAAELDPSKVEFHLHKAAALMKLGSIEPALESCDKAISLEPQNAKSFLRKGMIYVQAGDFDAARQTLNAGAKLDPSNKSFSTWLAKCGPESSSGSSTVTNKNLGKCDEALSALFDAHDQQGYPLVETVLEFIHRRTEFFKQKDLALDMVTSLVRRYCDTCETTQETAKLNIGAAPRRPNQDVMRTLPLPMSASAKAALEKAKKDREAELASDKGAAGPGGIKVGTQCKLNGCNIVYKDESSLREECVYHPGVPVFHEGYKYWSCCTKKKTTDFTEFLSFVGCTRGLCVFEDDPTKKKKALCRYDFFQQGPTVTVSVYAKKVDPEQSVVRVSGTRLSLSILFDLVKTFTLDVLLSGRVDPDACKVEILAPKVEITLRKADGSAWTELGTLQTDVEVADNAMLD